jgi:leucyl aminopeptidase (aminopeptidase T)
VLRDKLGEDGAEALVSLINAAGDQTKADALTFAEEKFERRISEEAAKLDRRITEEVARLDNRITEEVAKLDRRITEEVAKLEVKMANLDAKISEVKADLIHWMFIFWVGQLGATIGILFAFFRR